MTCFSGGTLDIFVEPHPPAPRLLIVGSLPVAQALAHLGKAIRYDVVALDPTGGDAMAHADTVLRDLDRIAEYVTPVTYAVVATHGEYDEPALRRLLETSVPYVGLVASRSRGEAVLRALEQDGVVEETRARVRYPAGLDIGARRGDEIAVSIVAEIIREGRALGEIEWGSEASPGGGPTASEVTATAPEVTATAPDVRATATSEVLPTATDPVCEMPVAVEGSLHTAEHEGRTYYFCCGGCRTKFTAEPERFLSAAGT